MFNTNRIGEVHDISRRVEKCICKKCDSRTKVSIELSPCRLSSPSKRCEPITHIADELKGPKLFSGF